MEIVIHQVLFTILDTESKITVPSMIMESLSDLETEFLKRKIQKVMNSDKREGSLSSDEKYNPLIKNMELNHFEEMAETLAERYFDLKCQAGLHELSDLFFVDFRFNELDYFLILDQPLKKSLTHRTDYEFDKPVNHLMEYRAILNEGLVKEDSFLLVNWRNQEVFVKEQRVDVNNQKCSLFQEKLFDLRAVMTPKETVALMEKQVKEISRKYEFDLKEILPEFKSAINDCEFLEIETVAKKVFEKSPVAKEEFRINAEQAGLTEAVPVVMEKLPKKDRTLKFVTESGIEIIVPAAYLKRRDKIEIVNNADGTTSISIKNIEKLNNR